MGREVRRVPANWQHPRDSKGNYIPLHGGSYSSAVAEWDEGDTMWRAGLREDGYAPPPAVKKWKPIEDEYKGMPYSEWDGHRPQKSEYMPDWSEDKCTHYQMYETTTEGTPISPVLESPEALARWLVDNNASAFAGQTASYEGWLRVCRGGFAPSAVITDGQMISGVDAL